MYFSYHDMKFAMYVLLGLVGTGFVITAIVLGFACGSVAEPVSFHLSSMILMVVGTGLLLFCAGLVMFPDQPEIWM